MSQLVFRSTYVPRLKAMAVHLLFSALLLLVGLYFVFGVWYPSPLDQAVGLADILWVFLGIDVVLGPLLTFIVFDSRKKELRRDLIIIVAIQVSAYLYGLHTLSLGRPVSIVFVVDDFEIVRKTDLIGDNQSGFKISILVGPRILAANYSKDPIISNKQKEGEMFEGISLARKTDAYQPLEDRSIDILKRAHQLNELYKFNKKEKVSNLLLNYKNATGFLAVRGFVEDMTALIDKNGNVIEIVNLRPWS
jgi:hypothetical protein